MPRGGLNSSSDPPWMLGEELEKRPIVRFCSKEDLVRYGAEVSGSWRRRW